MNKILTVLSMPLWMIDYAAREGFYSLVDEIVKFRNRLTKEFGE